MLIANNCTVESGSFMGDQLCALKACYLFVENEPDIDKIIMTMSPNNTINFIWQKFIDKYKIEIMWDDWNPGDWTARWAAWDKWRAERHINGTPFRAYREHYLRIHGGQRQSVLCGYERGLGRRNIYQYWYCGQENCPEELPEEVDWFDDSLTYHPELNPTRDVYIAPHCKTQGNYVFTFDFWSQVVRRLIEAGVSVTVGYDQPFCDDLWNHPLYKRYWGNHEEWFREVSTHKLVACGNTGTGWVAAACGVPMITMEPVGSQMPDHRYRECGLRNIIEVLVEPDSLYCSRRIIDEVNRKIVMTTGCYDVLHAGHIRHLKKSRSLGTKLIVALNSDDSIKRLKGSTRPINPQHQRKEVLESLRCVDEVRIFDDDDATSLFKEIKPDIITNGFGYTLDKVVGRELVESWGGRAVITCTGDAISEPSTTKIVNKVLESRDVAELCRLASAYSVNPCEKLKVLADELLKVIDLQGDIADLGTCKGGTGLLMRRLAPNKHLHLFDTWEGNPYDDPLCHHKRGEWATSMDDCQKLIGRPNQVLSYFKGEFKEVARKAHIASKMFCFVYIDMDTYQATLDALTFFWPILVSGGKIVIDDYAWEPCAGVKKAVDEFFPKEEYQRYGSLPGVGPCPVKVIEFLHTCVVTKQ